MIVEEFCENLKVVSSDFLMMKNTNAPCLFETLPMKLIYCESFNLACLLKSIATDV